MNALRNQISRMLSLQAREGGFAATLAVDPGFSLFPDHFPDQPIFPGICLVQAVLVAGALHFRAGALRLCALKNLKLMQPVRPGDRVVIEADVSESGFRTCSIRARLSIEDRRCAEISLVASAEEG